MFSKFVGQKVPFSLARVQTLRAYPNIGATHTLHLCNKPWSTSGHAWFIAQQPQHIVKLLTCSHRMESQKAKKERQTNSNSPRHKSLRATKALRKCPRKCPRKPKAKCPPLLLLDRWIVGIPGSARCSAATLRLHGRPAA